MQLRANAVSLYFQDDWRVSTNFTLNAGVRYEYQSPYSESNNHLVNLDAPPDFSAAVPVLAGQVGPYTGAYPLTIINPDRNNLSPRFGFAWRAQPKTVVRGGYGINYSSVPYLSVAQKLTAQPPFATTNTMIGTFAAPLALSNAFARRRRRTTTNNFGVDKNYRIGYVHLWNVDVQREMTPHADGRRQLHRHQGAEPRHPARAEPQRRPARTINGVQPFTWESSGARVDPALVLGPPAQAPGAGPAGWAAPTRTRKSRDNASSLGGGGGGTVAQNDKDLAAEWGPSSFDVRHRVTVDFSYELPFGPNRKWLNGEGWAGQIFGGWMMNGNLAFSSGSRYTARVTGAVDGRRRRRQRDAARELQRRRRSRSTTRRSIQFFNTAAFSVPVAGHLRQRGAQH